LIGNFVLASGPLGVVDSTYLPFMLSACDGVKGAGGAVGAVGAMHDPQPLTHACPGDDISRQPETTSPAPDSGDHTPSVRHQQCCKERRVEGRECERGQEAGAGEGACSEETTRPKQRGDASVDEWMGDSAHVDMFRR
jgi:hypothetical protein